MAFFTCDKIKKQTNKRDEISPYNNNRYIAANFARQPTSLSRVNWLDSVDSVMR